MPDATCLPGCLSHSRIPGPDPWSLGLKPKTPWIKIAEKIPYRTNDIQKSVNQPKKRACQFSSLFYANKIYFPIYLHLLLYRSAAQSEDCGQVTFYRVSVSRELQRKCHWLDKNQLRSSVILTAPHCYSNSGRIHGAKTQRKKKKASSFSLLQVLNSDKQPLLTLSVFHHWAYAFLIKDNCKLPVEI